MDQLDAALVAAQKLEKKLRQLRNADKVADADLSDAKQAVALLRQIGMRLGEQPLDIDSRAEKKHRREAY